MDVGGSLDPGRVHCSALAGLIVSRVPVRLSAVSGMGRGHTLTHPLLFSSRLQTLASSLTGPLILVQMLLQELMALLRGQRGHRVGLRAGLSQVVTQLHLRRTVRQPQHLKKRLAGGTVKQTPLLSEGMRT